MTDKERAVVMAFTGVAMLTGDKFSIFHKYIEDILNRPVWTHELADPEVWKEIKEKSRKDFLNLCSEEENRACEICVHNVQKGESRGCELWTCDFEKVGGSS